MVVNPSVKVEADGDRMTADGNVTISSYSLATASADTNGYSPLSGATINIDHSLVQIGVPQTTFDANNPEKVKAATLAQTQTNIGAGAVVKGRDVSVTSYFRPVAKSTADASSNTFIKYGDPNATSEVVGVTQTTVGNSAQISGTDALEVTSKTAPVVEAHSTVYDLTGLGGNGTTTIADLGVTEPSSGIPPAVNDFSASVYVDPWAHLSAPIIDLTSTSDKPYVFAEGKYYATTALPLGSIDSTAVSSPSAFIQVQGGAVVAASEALTVEATQSTNQPGDNDVTAHSYVYVPLFSLVSLSATTKSYGQAYIQIDHGATLVGSTIIVDATEFAKLQSRALVNVFSLSTNDYTDITEENHDESSLDSTYSSVTMTGTVIDGGSGVENVNIDTQGNVTSTPGVTTQQIGNTIGVNLVPVNSQPQVTFSSTINGALGYLQFTQTETNGTVLKGQLLDGPALASLTVNNASPYSLSFFNGIDAGVAQPQVTYYGLVSGATRLSESTLPSSQNYFVQPVVKIENDQGTIHFDGNLVNPFGTIEIINHGFGIYLDSPGVQFQGKNVIIQTDYRSIGESTKPILVDLSDNGSLTASAPNGDVFLEVHRRSGISYIDNGVAFVSTAPASIDSVTAGGQIALDLYGGTTGSLGSTINSDYPLGTLSAGGSLTITNHQGALLSQSGNTLLTGNGITLEAPGYAIGSASNAIKLDLTGGSLSASGNGVYLAQYKPGVNLVISHVDGGSGDVSLTSNGDIVNASTDTSTAILVGTNVSLNAPLGAIGSSTTALPIATTGSISAEALGDVYLTTPSLTTVLTIAQIISDSGLVNLIAGTLLSTSGTTAESIIAPKAILVGLQGVGTASVPLRTHVADLSVTAGLKAFYFAIPGDIHVDQSGSTTLETSGANGSIDLTVHGALTVAGNVESTNDMYLTVPDTSASGDNITLQPGSSLKSDSASVQLTAGDNITIQSGAQITASAPILITADDAPTDPDPGVGAVINSQGTLTSPSVFINGGNDADSITLGGTFPAQTSIMGNGGNDNIDLFDSALNAFVNGGSGQNTLILDGVTTRLDLTDPAKAANLKNISTIDMTRSSSLQLSLNQAAVDSITGPDHALRVINSPGDSVDIGPGWTQVGTEYIGARSFTNYVQGGDSLSVSSANASGFTITGGPSSGIGYNVKMVGDINGDGLADMVISNTSGNYSVTSTPVMYVVYGQKTQQPIDLSKVAQGIGGFEITGLSAVGGTYWSVAGAGDVNGDGRADLVIGSQQSSPGGKTNAGTVFVVFGKTDTNPVDLSNLGSGGFEITARRRMISSVPPWRAPATSTATAWPTWSSRTRD